MIFVFDIDGVLADDSRTKNLDPQNPKDMARFVSLAPELKPLKAVKVLKRMAAHGRVYLFTARSAAIRTLTQNWLYDQQIPHEDLCMRPFGNNDCPAELKRKMLMELFLRTKTKPVDILACDDDPAVQDMYLSEGCTLLWVKR